MKKIDWDNLNYYDFIGGIGIGVILLFGIYLGGLWYTTKDYRLETARQLECIYNKIPNPETVTDDVYGVKKMWLSYYVVGHRTYANMDEDKIMDWYIERLNSSGWHVDKRRREKNDKVEIYSVIMRNENFWLEISHIRESCRFKFFLLKEDWIYDKGL